MFKRVLVPIDKSPESEQALEPAISIALASDATLEIVLVRETILLTEMPHPVSAAERLAAEQYLHGIVERVKKTGLSYVSSMLLDGGIVDSIVARARQVRVDLIVMTSHFRTGLARSWVGSVADGIVRDSELPVLMLRPSHDADVASAVGTGIHRILVPLDGSAAGAAILPAVRALAICTDAQLLLLRIVQPPSLAVSLLSTPGTVSQMGIALSKTDFDAVENATERLVNEATEDLDNTLAELVAIGLTNVSRFVVKNDHLPEAIVAFAATQSVDLIALSTHGRGTSRLFVGSVADGVLRDGALPVLLQRPSPSLVDQPHLTAQSVECQLPGLMV